MTDSTDPLRASLPLERGASWLRGHSAHSDVVISSRLRLARNLAGHHFLRRAPREERQKILDTVREAILHASLAPRVLWMDVHTAQQLDRTLLLERHLISREHAKGADPRGVAISIPDETLSIMVNEEDHLRIQVLRSGFDLHPCFEHVTRVDDQLSAALEFAYSPRFGYLTACPTNVGTGLRVSVMLHLPALKLAGEMDKVRQATKDMSLAVRGYYGEGSDAAGDFVQISNQTTLGKSELEILNELHEEIIPRILDYERAARKLLLNKRRRSLEDTVFRALGILRNARLLTPEEALTHLSHVRLGVVSGLISDTDEQTINQLILLAQPAHLQRLVGHQLDQNHRREARADLLRARLTPGTPPSDPTPPPPPSPPHRPLP